MTTLHALRKSSGLLLVMIVHAIFTTTPLRVHRQRARCRHAFAFVALASVTLFFACEPHDELAYRRVTGSDLGGDHHEICIRQRHPVETRACPAANEMQTALRVAGVLVDEDRLGWPPKAREALFCCYEHEMEEATAW